MLVGGCLFLGSVYTYIVGLGSLPLLYQWLKCDLPNSHSSTCPSFQDSAYTRYTSHYSLTYLLARLLCPFTLDMRAVTKLSAAALWGSAFASAWAPQFGWNSKPQGSAGPTGYSGPHGPNFWNSTQTQGSPWPHPTSHPWSPSGVLPQNETNGMCLYLVSMIYRITA